ncbi:MAG: hypothetical protein FWE15_19370 [Actinomycetia bacterium]|nr:hypothetical protein [Actinomycetes bacterium]
MGKRTVAVTILAALSTVLALLAGFGNGAAQAAKAKVGPYYLPSGAVGCSYNGLTLTSMTVPSARVSMDKALFRAGRRHQYVGISLTLLGQNASGWHQVAQHGGTGARHVAYSVNTHVRAYTAIPSRKKRGMLTFDGLEAVGGYSAYRIRLSLMWYAPDNRHLRGRVTTTLAGYQRGSSCPAQLPAAPVIGNPRITYAVTANEVTPGLHSGTATLTGINGPLAGTLTLYRANSAAPCTQATAVWTYPMDRGNGAFQLIAPAAAWATPGYYTWGFSAAANATNNALPLTCTGIITAHYSVGKIVIAPGDGKSAGYKYALGADFPVDISFASPSGTVLNDGHAYSVTVSMYTGSNYVNIHCGSGQLVKSHTVLVSNLGGTYTLKFNIGSSANAGKFRFQAVWNDKGGPQKAAYVPPSDCKLDRAWG